MDLFSQTEPPALPFSIPSGFNATVRWDQALKVFQIDLPDGELLFADGFFSPTFTDRCLAYFQENDTYDWQTTDWRGLSDAQLAKVHFRNIHWQHDRIKLYGKSVPLPRLSAWYGDPGKSYTYSGLTLHPHPWNDGLRTIKQAVEPAAGERFNSVLLNWYRNGEDHMSWHADDEPELGCNPVIASVNFGASRDFVLRRTDEPRQKIKIPLHHGSLLVMRGALQHHWQHSVPKRKRVTGSRFNLTFRRIV
jgi:alkylated DNA repair dioxygenase AlkB